MNTFVLRLADSARLEDVLKTCCTQLGVLNACNI
jgi:hypothetical protein